MFKFGFQPEELNEEFVVKTEASDETDTHDATPAASSIIPCVACTEIHPTAEQLAKTPADLKHGLILFAGDNEVMHLKSDVLIGDLVEEQIAAEQRRRDEQAAKKQAADAHATDLIPGVYEGGGKIWECTQDLGDYLGLEEEEVAEGAMGPPPQSLLKSLCGPGKRVLDLGCGAGILGVLALQQGAEVHFQDYNSDIIAKVTIPNVVLNSTPFRNLTTRARFFAGDWSHYVEAQSDARFDVIVTCETIYNPANNQKIIDVLRQMLRPRTGVAFLAAKTYYFGVGGGVRAFEALLRRDGALQSQVVWQSTENVQREILRITHRSDDV